jgi:hypothetical protein
MVEKPVTARDESGGGDRPKGAETKDYTEYLSSLHADYSRELNQLAARVQERLGQSFADYRRALTEAQVNAQSEAETAFRNYATAMQRASPQTSPSEINEINQAYQKACREAQASAQSAADRASEALSKAMNGGFEEANRNWDSTCARYVDALKESVGRLDAAAATPAALAAVGQSFLWIAGHVQPPKAAASKP